jgi:hypothetical protein
MKLPLFYLFIFAAGTSYLTQMSFSFPVYLFIGFALLAGIGSLFSDISDAPNAVYAPKSEFSSASNGNLTHSFNSVSNSKTNSDRFRSMPIHCDSHPDKNCYQELLKLLWKSPQSISDKQLQFDRDFAGRLSPNVCKSVVDYITNLQRARTDGALDYEYVNHLLPYLRFLSKDVRYVAQIS